MIKVPYITNIPQSSSSSLQHISFLSTEFETDNNLIKVASISLNDNNYDYWIDMNTGIIFYNDKNDTFSNYNEKLILLEKKYLEKPIEENAINILEHVKKIGFNPGEIKNFSTVKTVFKDIYQEKRLKKHVKNLKICQGNLMISLGQNQMPSLTFDENFNPKLCHQYDIAEYTKTHYTFSQLDMFMFQNEKNMKELNISILHPEIFFVSIEEEMNNIIKNSFFWEMKNFNDYDNELFEDTKNKIHRLSIERIALFATRYLNLSKKQNEHHFIEEATNIYNLVEELIHQNNLVDKKENIKEIIKGVPNQIQNYTPFANDR